MSESGIRKGDFAWRKAPLFRFCDPADWENFAGLTESFTVTPATVLWHEGESGSCLYCVVSGHLEAVKETPEWGKPIIMAEFHAGATVGVFAVGEEVAHSTTLQVVEPAELLCFSTRQAAVLQEKYPQTAARLWRGAAHLELCRLRQANQRLVTLF